MIHYIIYPILLKLSQSKPKKENKTERNNNRRPRLRNDSKTRSVQGRLTIKGYSIVKSVKLWFEGWGLGEESDPSPVNDVIDRSSITALIMDATQFTFNGCRIALFACPHKHCFTKSGGQLCPRFCPRLKHLRDRLSYIFVDHF